MLLNAAIVLRLSLLTEIMAKDVFDAAKAGDEVAIRIVNRAAYYFGKSMALWLLC